MAGTMPKTKLLLLHNNVSAGEFNTYLEVAELLGISIDSKGYITFMCEVQNPSYAMGGGVNCWSDKGAMADWAKHYMTKNMNSSYKIYRFLT